MSNVKFSSVINLPSVDFQKIVRDLSSISDKIEIKSVTTDRGSELIFKCSGGFAEAEIRRSECDGNMTFIEKQDKNKIFIHHYFSSNMARYYE